MPKTSFGRDEYLFVQQETNFGEVSYPQSSGFVPHLSSKLRLDEARENRAERTNTRGVSERVALRKSCSFDIEGYLTAKQEDEFTGMATLLSASGFDLSFNTAQATVLETLPPTTTSFAVNPSDAFSKGDFVVVDEQIRHVVSNEAGTITVLPELKSAPSPQTPVTSTPKMRPASATSPLSFSLFRRGSVEAELVCGCVPASISLQFSGGEPVRVKTSGAAKDVVAWASTALAEDIDQDQTTFAIDNAQNLEPSAIIAVESELMKVVGVDYEQNEIAVESGWNNTEKASHDEDTEISPLWVEPTSLGKLLYGTSGEIFIGEGSLVLVEFEFICNSGSELFNREYGTNASTRALFDKKREVSLRAKILVDSGSIDRLMCAKHKKSTQAFIAAYGNNCAVALYLPKVEFDIPELSREPESTLVVELRGVALEDEGFDEAFVGILL